LRPVAFQQRNDLAPEKRAVHAKLQLVTSAERRGDLREEGAQETKRSFPVVHVARPVLYSHHLPLCAS
jgi:hypothetical protein